jgi:putative oxidoreductase
MNRLNAWAPYVLSLLRIVAALLFIEHGTAKMFGFPQAMPGMGGFDLMSLMGLAACLELFGGLLVLIGLFTRPVALLLSGEMAIGYFMVHAKQSFYPLINQGDAAILFCFVFLYLVFAGAGPWSLDARMGRITR